MVESGYHRVNPPAGGVWKQTTSGSYGDASRASSQHPPESLCRGSAAFRRRARLLVLWSISLTLVAGCGSPASDHPGASQSPSPSKSANLARQELKRYFAALGELVPEANRASRLTDEAHDAFTPEDSSTWSAYAKALRQSNEVVTDVEAGLAAIEPPRELKKAHAQLVRQWRLLYEMNLFVSEQLRLKQPYTKWWKTWESRYAACRVAGHRWEVAVKAEATKQNVRVPRALLDGMRKEREPPSAVGADRRSQQP